MVDVLRQGDIPVFGSFVAVAGNLAALARNERFLGRDLNRAWTADMVAQLRSRDPATDTVEDREQRELLEVFEDCLARARGPVVFVDLHSSSADGASFICLADTIPNRRLAMALSVPTILGLEECIDGAVMEFFSERGLVAVAIEGGQHGASTTVDNLEAALWLSLIAVGVVDCHELDPGQVDIERHRRTLRESGNGLPPVLEIRHRHVITPSDGFVMEPGFRSFQKVEKDRLLARDVRGELRAPEACRVLLPLYQGQGQDGYFLCRVVRPSWLRVAAVMRWLRLDAILPWVPGVRRDPDHRGSLLVNPGVARYLPVEVFHLLGFRKRRQVGHLLRFSRRRVDPTNWTLGPRKKS